MRSYIRHPSEIPIELVVDSGEQLSCLSNISYGGFACRVDHRIEPDHEVELKITTVDPEYCGHGVVAWCEENEGQWEIGVRFDDPTEAFRSRMVEQVCHIENYRNEIWRDEGRVLSPEQAAQEWIERYAGSFASLFTQIDDKPDTLN